jgi:hypothetical protein
MGLFRCYRYYIDWQKFLTRFSGIIKKKEKQGKGQKGKREKG